MIMAGLVLESGRLGPPCADLSQPSLLQRLGLWLGLITRIRRAIESLTLGLGLSLSLSLSLSRGEETQKWWKSIVEMEVDQRMPGAPQSRQEQGLEHT